MAAKIICLGKKVPRTFRKFIIFQYRSTDIPLNDVAVLRLEVPIDFHFFPYVRSGKLKKKSIKIRIYFFFPSRPLCLPDPMRPGSEEGSEEGAAAIVAGWGKTRFEGEERKEEVERAIEDI